MTKHEPQKASVVASFQTKCQQALAKMKEYQAFEASDQIVAMVLDCGRTLFNEPLDKMTPDKLLRIGGKLSGAYAYLGQKASYARAERDVYRQKADEVEKELTLSYLGEEYKVTEARAKVSADASELQEFCIQKEAEKNQWESISEACQTMILFIQSALKLKVQDRFQSRQIQEQG